MVAMHLASKRGNTFIVRLVLLRLFMLGIFLFLGIVTYNQFSQPPIMQIMHSNLLTHEQRTLHFSPIIGELYENWKSSLSIQQFPYSGACGLICMPHDYYSIAFTFYGNPAYGKHIQYVYFTDCTAAEATCPVSLVRDAHMAERAFAVWDVPVLEIG